MATPTSWSKTHLMQQTLTIWDTEKQHPISFNLTLALLLVVSSQTAVTENSDLSNVYKLSITTSKHFHTSKIISLESKRCCWYNTVVVAKSKNESHIYTCICLANSNQDTLLEGKERPTYISSSNLIDVHRSHIFNRHKVT